MSFTEVVQRSRQFTHIYPEAQTWSQVPNIGSIEEKGTMCLKGKWNIRIMGSVLISHSPINLRQTNRAPVLSFLWLKAMMVTQPSLVPWVKNGCTTSLLSVNEPDPTYIHTGRLQRSHWENKQNITTLSDGIWYFCRTK